MSAFSNFGDTWSKTVLVALEEVIRKTTLPEGSTALDITTGWVEAAKKNIEREGVVDIIWNKGSYKPKSSGEFKAYVGK